MRKNIQCVGLVVMLWLGGCAKHADFVELRDNLSTVSKSQDQDQKRLDALQRRLESLERVKDSESGKSKGDPKIDELSARVQKLESRMAAKPEEIPSAPAAPKMEPAPGEPVRPSKPQKPASASDVPTMMPGVPTITPTSAFNLAYNDYLNGKYDLAVAGFQRFVKDFPGTSLTPNGYYWLGESSYQQKDYVRAIQAFEYLTTEFPGNEKVPAALFKSGLAAGETGDLVKSKKHLKRVIEEFPTSDEAKLAKSKLAEIR
ncbi:MAG: tol-pal system protein YbgF [Nitrospirota bacterium]|nr:tol-pal system protein YbgF [Nitrospirota bacterium]MDP2382407.1 tol-pal system protein YbgF [Nitrospirota bacterium]